MRKARNALLVVLSLIFICAILYLLPPIRSRVDYRVDLWRTQLRYALKPPEQAVFVPQDQVAAAVQATFKAMTPAASATLPATSTPVLGSTEPPATAPTATIQPTPLPASISLTGVRYMDQHGLLNYCAPTNLAMALSYWGWKGDRGTTGKWLKPFAEDLNVMPYEMVNYVLSQTEYKAVYRSGGTLDLIKKLVAGGFPVLVEKGAVMQDRLGKMSWMGHYELVTGYDDAKGQFVTQDSYYSANYPVKYDTLLDGWRSFNYTFIVVYSQKQEGAVNALLGDYADDQTATRIALKTAESEMGSLSGIDQYFAYFNRGTSLVDLQDYAGAAQTYDLAFKLYEGLPSSTRPWRMLWYQTGPYFAYYYSGRYSDLVNLATLTLDAASNPYLEESYYWRGMGEVQIGKPDDAAADFKQALEYHPGFQPAIDQLQYLGIQP